MKKAYLLIDYVNDFIADNGVLTLGKRGQEISENIVSVMQQAGDDMFMDCADWHDEKTYKNSPEAKSFPIHCEDTGSGMFTYKDVDELICSSGNYHYIQKQRYSAFCGTELDLLLRQEKVDVVVLMGVCTDICVLHTAIDAYNLGYNIVLLEDCCCGTTADKHDFAKHHIEKILGGIVSNSEEYILSQKMNNVSKPHNVLVDDLFYGRK